MLQHLQALQSFRPQFLASSPEGKLLHQFHLGRIQEPPLNHQEQVLGESGNFHGALVPPPYRQDPLLRQLQQLQPGQEEHGLQPPSQQQALLARQLKANHGGEAAEGLLVPKLAQTGLAYPQLELARNADGRLLSPPKQHLKSDRIMNMENAVKGPESKSSDSDKERKLLNMEAKVKALLFELQPRKKQSEERHAQQEEKTAPLILDNSVIKGKQFAPGFQSESEPKETEEFDEHRKRSKFQSLLTEISKAMVALETVKPTHKIRQQYKIIPNFANHHSRLLMFPHNNPPSPKYRLQVACFAGSLFCR